MAPTENAAKFGPQIDYTDLDLDLGSSANSTLSPATTLDSIRRASDDTAHLRESQDVTELHKVPTSRTRRDSHMGEALENLASTMSVDRRESHMELGTVPSRRSERERMPDLAEEAGSPTRKHQ